MQVLFIYGNFLEFIFTLEKLQKSVLIMCKSSKLAGSTFWKLYSRFSYCTHSNTRRVH